VRRNKANLASVLLSFGVLSCSGQLAIGTIDLDGGTSRNDVAFGTTVGSDAGADEGGAGLRNATTTSRPHTHGAGGLLCPPVKSPEFELDSSRCAGARLRCPEAG